MSPPAKKRVVKETAPPPVIIVKKGGNHGRGHHGGAWKVAYADFVTTMMALFIVLWAAGQSSDIRSSIASYFRNPAIPMLKQGGQGAGVMPAATGVVAKAEALPAPVRNETDAESETLEQAGTELRRGFEQDPDLKELLTQVQIEVRPEGLRVQIVERDESLFFEVGSARVTQALTRLLGVIARVVGRLPNNVIVEGHTDSRQYARDRRDYSNWELSADRANSARRLLEGSGLRPGQIARVVGFADHDLLLRDRPLDAQNRRVSIIVARKKLPPSAGFGSAREAIDQLGAKPAAVARP
jgi:chemotaxis protein MotB